RCCSDSLSLHDALPISAAIFLPSRLAEAAFGLNYGGQRTTGQGWRLSRDEAQDMPSGRFGGIAGVANHLGGAVALQPLDSDAMRGQIAAGMAACLGHRLFDRGGAMVTAHVLNAELHQGILSPGRTFRLSGNRPMIAPRRHGRNSPS